MKFLTIFALLTISFACSSDRNEPENELAVLEINDNEAEQSLSQQQEIEVDEGEAEQTGLAVQTTDVIIQNDEEQERVSLEPLSPDDCLQSQDLYASDVNIEQCPALPPLPMPSSLGSNGPEVSLGAWELGQTLDGDTWKYGSLKFLDDGTANLLYYGDENSAAVNEQNIECWAKSYYRLRAILQNPPTGYAQLVEAGFQGRFFQFQTDLRNGSTGFKKISSYRDHLVKWVSVIDETGACQQPTLAEFESYVNSELLRRGLL